jgi:hypothetical protein
VQRHLLTVPTFGHIVMIACAVASYENIHGFFKVLHGSELIAVGLGVAIGAALVMAAGLLSGMAWNWRNPRLQLIAGVTLALALLSGGIQGASYAQHGLWWLWAGLIGLALPVVGELGIALAVSAYEQEQKAKRAALADEEIEARINAAIDSAMTDIDLSSTKRDVERAARVIVKGKLDALLARRAGNVDAGETADDSHQTAAGFGPENLPAANAERQRLIDERQRAIVELIAAYGPLSTTELIAKLKEDRGIEASERTVRDDCNNLAQLVKAGRKWDMVRSIANELPTMPAPAVNGYHR